MNWQSLWFVLAGLILGFTISTLWEWFYFRRKRLTAHDQRAAEPERALLDYQMQDAQPDAPTYRSTGALLESEEAEELADLATPSEEAHAPVPSTLTPSEEEDLIPREATPSTASSLTTAIPSIAEAGDLEEETNAGDSDVLTAQPPADDLLPDINDETATANDESDDGESNEPVAALLVGGVAGAALAATVAEADEVSEDRADTTRADEGADDDDEDAVATDEPGGGETIGPAAPSAVEDIVGPALVAASTDVDEEPVAATDSAGAEDDATSDEMLPANIERPDDLCRIEGIGRARRRAFYNAGIFTWHQLGQLTPEGVRDVVNMGVAEAWPARARELAERYGREGAEYSGPAPDDLTKVRGIGQTTMELLYRHGIWRFEQLAALSPEQLEEIVPATASVTVEDREQWLASAKELVDGTEEG